MSDSVQRKLHALDRIIASDSGATPGERAAAWEAKQRFLQRHGEGAGRREEETAIFCFGYYYLWEKYAMYYLASFVLNDGDMVMWRCHGKQVGFEMTEAQRDEFKLLWGFHKRFVKTMYKEEVEHLQEKIRQIQHQIDELMPTYVPFAYAEANSLRPDQEPAEGEDCEYGPPDEDSTWLWGLTERAPRVQMLGQLPSGVL